MLMTVSSCAHYSFSLSSCYLKLMIIFLNEILIHIFLFYPRTDSRFLVLPSGELHIRDVVPEDGFKSYQCRTKHKLTGETRLSATKGRLVITGKYCDYYFYSFLSCPHVICFPSLYLFHHHYFLRFSASAF